MQQRRRVCDLPARPYVGRVQSCRAPRKAPRTLHSSFCAGFVLPLRCVRLLLFRVFRRHVGSLEEISARACVFFMSGLALILWMGRTAGFQVAAQRGTTGRGCIVLFS